MNFRNFPSFPAFLFFVDFFAERLMSASIMAIMSIPSTYPTNSMQTTIRVVILSKFKFFRFRTSSKVNRFKWTSAKKSVVCLHAHITPVVLMSFGQHPSVTHDFVLSFQWLQLDA